MRRRNVPEDPYYRPPLVKPDKIDLSDPGWSRAFHGFVRTAREGGVRDYLALGVSCEVIGPSGRTPLIEAVLAHKPKMIQLLVDAGADLNRIVTVPIEGKSREISALGQAVEHGCAEEADLLISLGADATVCPELRDYAITPEILREMVAACRAREVLVAAAAKARECVAKRT